MSQWLPRITAEVEGAFNFPSDQNKFCDGSEKSVPVTYTIIRGDATDYTLTFEGNAIPEIKGKVDGNPIVIPIAITANIPRPAAVQLYTDMLLADNHESKTTQIALPSGIYSGSLINGGEKSGFKLIVK